ncbi:MAG: hypothetical protein U9O63_07010 [Actinomycetota bacterium]|nr:hypothetical protein [Actinomycetota bacterium]
MDSNTKWETEALRESPRQARSRPQVSQHTDEDAEAVPRDWVTLREASDVTGIPIGTLRKWARRDAIPSLLESEGGHDVRLVNLPDVLTRARELGRDLTPKAAGPEEPSHETVGQRPAPTPDTMIVPIDAWNKMITQLGNLHEAGQQLAEARERAGKAETEARFLRERLAELREEAASSAQPAPPPDSGPPEAADSAPAGQPATEPRWRAIYRRLRSGRG